MHLTSRELALIADIFKLLADRAVPEDVLRLEVKRHMLDLLRVDHLGSTVWDGEEHSRDLRIRRGKQRDNFSDRDLALLDLIRPAYTVALARARHEAGVADVNDADAAESQTDGDLLARLTRREREVVALAAEGLLDKEIAQRLGISYTTVRTHLDRSFQKLGINNRSRLARLFQITRR
jgi:DNA-binding CsgD family transcriptional regulator